MERRNHMWNASFRRRWQRWKSAEVLLLAWFESTIEQNKRIECFTEHGIYIRLYRVKLPIFELVKSRLVNST